jgi:hypothetical protein
MARKIIELVREKKRRMSDRDADGNLTPQAVREANDNGSLSIPAILGGIKSPEWRTYMLQFVEKDDQGNEVDPRQLQRLLATDGTEGDILLDMHRAYLVSNGPCGANSPDRGLPFDFFVESIDRDLDDPCPLPIFPDENVKAINENIEAGNL